MKSVLISIQPKWCELIASGKKTVEVRKTKPNLSTPFKCYIYCTKGFKPNTRYSYKTWAGYGKVIGEFLCDSITEWHSDPQSKGYFITMDELALTQLTYGQLNEYGKGQTLYGWHISNLRIYDKPKDLSEFKKPCNKKCDKCDYLDVQEIGAYEHTREIKTCLNFIERSPQSWCYVEKAGEG